MKFFKPEDFGVLYLDGIQRSACAAYANAMLEKEGKVVYCLPGILGSPQYLWDTEMKQQPKTYSHIALLINIEPIEPCKHPSEKVESYYAEACRLETKYFKCECGLKVKAIGFEDET